MTMPQEQPQKKSHPQQSDQAYQQDNQSKPNKPKSNDQCKPSTNF